MIDNNINNKIEDFLGAYKDRSVEAFAGGNKNGAAYLACLCGMWTHISHREHKTNPFSNEDILLYKWYNLGIAASKQAVNMNEVLRKQEEKRLKILSKTKKT